MRFKFDKSSSFKIGDVNVFFVTNASADTLQLPHLLQTESEDVKETLQLYRKDSLGKFGEISVITVKAQGGLKKFIFCGIGEAKDLSKLQVQELGGIIASKLNACKLEQANIIIDGKETESQGELFAVNIAEGIKLKNYCFDKYFKDKKETNKLYLKEITFYTQYTNLEALFSEREKIIDSTNFTRDLVSEPANVLNPEAFVDVCKELEALGVKVTVLDKKQLKSLNMNALLGVGQGSNSGTYVVTMEWNGAKDQKDSQPIAFVGKGITFDTGGINLKPSGPSISMMKYDMGGAAVVTGLIRSLASRKAKVNVIGAIGLAENMPSGNAQRPGDVVTSMSGQTIEVDNTDAEGRLLLSDVMWYTQETFKPKIMIDLATLTGAIVIALGHHNAGLFSDDDELVSQLTKAGLNTGEKVWRLPLGQCYDELINSNIADVKNVGKDGAGSITAAQFLKRFVKKGCIWAHIDIAGVVWLDNGGKLSPRGATGYGVRLLNEFLIQNYEPK
ncbi:leucyl aminopeptidase [Candidatus Bandiella euplotis]|uniref:Probable cytosol aminopeptidase n=1 Tax=Candidatus Bandiella euplotis TaxID=1664265 RepID=A0ABZ0UKT2_9RICK|nr:leucyl aminopeptidase [Candidatus Bandiella woodruffii]WPX96745.1 Cytosol aminopeptidase [Candidatus Bandiella woodruffii]